MPSYPTPPSSGRTKCVRGIGEPAPVVGGEPEQITRFTGPARHPVLKVLRSVTGGLVITLLVHQSGFGPYATRDYVPPIGSPNRYLTMRMTQAEYDALPDCSYQVSEDGMLRVREL